MLKGVRHAPKITASHDHRSRHVDLSRLATRLYVGDDFIAIGVQIGGDGKLGAVRDYQMLLEIAVFRGGRDEDKPPAHQDCLLKPKENTRGREFLADADQVS